MSEEIQTGANPQAVAEGEALKVVDPAQIAVLGVAVAGVGNEEQVRRAAGDAARAGATAAMTSDGPVVGLGSVDVAAEEKAALEAKAAQEQAEKDRQAAERLAAVQKAQQAAENVAASKPGTLAVAVAVQRVRPENRPDERPEERPENRE